MDAPSPPPPTIFPSSFEIVDWLRDKPRDVCVTIASRAVLRVWPLHIYLNASSRYYQQEHVFLQLFRGILFSNSTTRVQATLLGSFISSAFPRGTVADAIRDMVVLASRNDGDDLSYDYLARQTINSVDAATANYSMTTDYATTYAISSTKVSNFTWDLVSRDVDAFINGESIETVRALNLWYDEVGHFVYHDSQPSNSADSVGSIYVEPREYYININPVPEWAQDAWQQFKSQLLGYDNGWEIWIEWYERRLKGAPFSAQDFAKDKAFARALEDLDLWQEPDEQGEIGKGKNREASDVNTRIKTLIDAELAKLAPIEKADGDDAEIAIPPQRPAAIQPIWDKEMLTLPKEAVKAEVSPEHLLTALQAMKAELKELFDDVGDSNVDPRLKNHVSKMNSRILENTLPTQFELFRLAHEIEALAAYRPTVMKEWADIYAIRFSLTIETFKNITSKISAWISFKESKPSDAFSDEALANIASLAEGTIEMLRDEISAEFVNPVIPDAFQQLLDLWNDFTTENQEVNEDISLAKQELERDIVNSTHNILVSIFDKITPILKHCVKKFGNGFSKEFNLETVSKAFEEAGGELGKTLIKWFKRAIIWSPRVVIGKIAGIPFLESLAQTFPDTFGWLNSVLRFLGFL